MSGIWIATVVVVVLWALVFASCGNDWGSDEARAMVTVCAFVAIVCLWLGRALA